MSISNVLMLVLIVLEFVNYGSYIKSKDIEENHFETIQQRVDFMPKPNRTKTLSFTSSKELSQWLRLNHTTEAELWIKIYKKNSGVTSVTWDDVVIEALCWGWIDGIKKSLDDDSYLQRITPRKKQSCWSKRNRDHAERLIQEGRMRDAGLIQVNAAKADGRWEKAYVASELTIPEDFIDALEKKPKAKQFFQSLNKSSRYVIAHGLTSAKKAETRQRRFDKFMGMLDRGEKPL